MVLKSGKEDSIIDFPRLQRSTMEAKRCLVIGTIVYSARGDA